MTDLTAWFPLWERCPELKPEGVTPLMFQGKSIGFSFGGIFAEAGGAATITPSVPAPTQMVAAMIRDRAVIVGGDKWGFNMVWAGAFARYDRPYEWQVYSAIKHTRLSQHANPTEALRLACCSVLEVEP